MQNQFIFETESDAFENEARTAAGNWKGFRARRALRNFEQQQKLSTPTVAFNESEFDKFTGSLAQEVPQANQQASFENTKAQIRSQLLIPFKRPDDPNLLKRRKELHRLFDLVPSAFAKTFYDQLQNKADPFGYLFHYKLATPTTVEMLGILKKKFVLLPPPLTPLQWKVLGLLARGEPLPRTLEAEFQEALERFNTFVRDSWFNDPVNQDEVSVLLCLLDMLSQKSTTDKFIVWGKRCPLNYMRGNPKMLCFERFAPIEEQLLTQRGSPMDIPDLERSMICHLKPLFLSIHLAYPDNKDTTGLFESLMNVVHEIKWTIERLNLYFNKTISAEKKEKYVYSLIVIHDLVKKIKKSRSSIYSCLKIDVE